MIDHLPECNCTCSDCCGSSSPCRYCICDRLRACEQRVENRFHFYTGPDVYASGYTAALDAAREAVEALPPSSLPERWGIRTAMNFRGDVLAAINALREKNE